MSYQPKFTITYAITEALTYIERSRGFLEAVKLSEEWLSQMQKRALVLEAHHTTHIEGTHLSLEEASRLLKGENVPSVDPNDRQELLNYLVAFEFVSDYLLEEKPITESLIREIHARLVQNVRGNAATPGEYRKVQNFVVNSLTKEIIYTPPPAYDIPILMRELVSWLAQEKEIHPILVAGIAQFQFVQIHPFLDGNGRTARLLSTLCLYMAGYDFKRLFTLSEYYDRDRPQYYAALESVRQNELDLTGWLEFFSLGLKTQLLEIQRETKQVLKLELVAQEKEFSKSQKTILELALQQEKFTLKELQERCPEVSKRTLQRELRRLQEMGFLVATGATTSRYYRISPTCDIL